MTNIFSPLQIVVTEIATQLAGRPLRHLCRLRSRFAKRDRLPSSFQTYLGRLRHPDAGYVAHFIICYNGLLGWQTGLSRQAICIRTIEASSNACFQPAGKPCQASLSLMKHSRMITWLRSDAKLACFRSAQPWDTIQGERYEPVHVAGAQRRQRE